MDTVEHDVEDDATTDEFASSKGFEFVNTSSYHTTDDQDHSDRLSSDDNVNVNYSEGERDHAFLPRSSRNL